MLVLCDKLSREEADLIGLAPDAQVTNLARSLHSRSTWSLTDNTAEVILNGDEADST